MSDTSSPNPEELKPFLSITGQSFALILESSYCTRLAQLFSFLGHPVKDLQKVVNKKILTGTICINWSGRLKIIKDDNINLSEECAMLSTPRWILDKFL